MPSSASVAMARFIAANTDMDFEDASMLLSFAGNLCTNQIVDPLMTARYEMPKWIFDAYGYEFR